MTGQLAPTWQVQLLGPIRAWRDGAEVDLGTARMRAVFAVLAVHANRVVSKTELVDAIWGQAPPSKVAASLYTYISRLRRALEPPGSPDRGTRMIESAGTGYSLRLDSQAVDVTRFVALRDECESLLDSGDIAGATAMLNSALELWYGEPLSGLTGPFAQSQRIRLTELRLAMLEQRAEATLAAGRAAEAVAQLSGLIAEHPTRETLRGLLLIALYRSGRTVEALDSYREARETMVAELGIEPGPALRRIHDQLLADDPALLRDRFKAAAVTAPRDTGDGARTPHTADFVGRARELGELRDRIADLNQGRGCVVWIEGEPGIGKSALVTEAIGPSGGGRIRVLRATGDELGQRWPLWLIMDCLAVTPRSPDPRRRELVGARYGNRRPGQGWDPVDPLPATVDRILGLVGELCAEGPLVLVLEDLQWADEASLLVWRNLVKLTRKVPLMLVGVCRPVPKREELDYLREAACADGGLLIRLGPLAEQEVGQLAAALLRAQPSEPLLELAHKVAGNPLYLTEVVGTMLCEGMIEIDAGRADVAESVEYSVPPTLSAAIGRRLDFLSDGLRDILRWASLLGLEFNPGDLAIILEETEPELVAAMEQAVVAGLLEESGDRLAFRHPLVRHALYHAMSPAVRDLLHRQAAELLDKAGAQAGQVAEQLLAISNPADVWMIEWTPANVNAVATMSPMAAAELLQRAVMSPVAPARVREVLGVRLARLRFWLGESPETEARMVLSLTHDADRAAEMRLILAYLDYSQGNVAGALDALKATARDPAVPDRWRARHRSLQAMIERAGLDDLNAAEVTAQRARARATDAGDAFAIAHSLQNLWQVESVRRHHGRALEYVNAALAALGDEPAFSDLQLSLLDNKVFTLQNLDRLAEATSVLAAAERPSVRQGLPGGLHIPAAVHCFWLGRWDEALAKLDGVVQDEPEITFYGLRQRWSILLLHGVAALIAAHRGDAAGLSTYLDAASSYSWAGQENKENCDFLLAADAIAEEQAGRPDLALVKLEPILDPQYARMMLRHQWLPTVVRYALEADRGDIVTAAIEVCEAEARLETVPARAVTAAAWCRGLSRNDASELLSAAAHFDAVGRAFESASVREDAAVVLASKGRGAEARSCFLAASAGYANAGALWDIRRVESRLRPFGIVGDGTGKA